MDFGIQVHPTGRGDVWLEGMMDASGSFQGSGAVDLLAGFRIDPVFNFDIGDLMVDPLGVARAVSPVQEGLLDPRPRRTHARGGNTVVDTLDGGEGWAQADLGALGAREPGYRGGYQHLDPRGAALPWEVWSEARPRPTHGADGTSLSGGEGVQPAGFGPRHPRDLDFGGSGRPGGAGGVGTPSAPGSIRPRRTRDDDQGIEDARPAAAPEPLAQCADRCGRRCWLASTTGGWSPPSSG